MYEANGEEEALYQLGSLLEHDVGVAYVTLHARPFRASREEQIYKVDLDQRLVLGGDDHEDRQRLAQRIVDEVQMRARAHVEAHPPAGPERWVSIRWRAWAPKGSADLGSRSWTIRLPPGHAPPAVPEQSTTEVVVATLARLPGTYQGAMDTVSTGYQGVLAELRADRDEARAEARELRRLNRDLTTAELERARAEVEQIRAQGVQSDRHVLIEAAVAQFGQVAQLLLPGLLGVEGLADSPLAALAAHPRILELAAHPRIAELLSDPDGLADLLESLVVGAEPEVDA